MLELTNLKSSNTDFDLSKELSFEDQQNVCGSGGAALGTFIGGPLGTVPGAKIGSVVGGTLGVAIGAYSGFVSSSTLGFGDAGRTSATAASGYFAARIGSALGGASLAD